MNSNTYIKNSKPNSKPKSFVKKVASSVHPTYNSIMLNKQAETQMSKYITSKTEDGFWMVTDELQTFTEVFETRAMARLRIRQLNVADVTSNITHIEGTYGTGVERDDTANEQTVDTQVAEAVTVVAVDEMPADLKRNSDKVRWRITLAKANNEDKETVVKWAVATLGQKRPLAWSYVKNNWDKA